MRGLVNAVFGAWWTAAVTTIGVTGTRLFGDADFVRRAERVWARGLLRGMGIELEVHGAENVPPSPCLVMANHESYLDVPVLIAALPRVPGFIAKRELEAVPFLGLALRSGGHVLLDRANATSALAAFKTVAAEIRSGKTIAVFPEGTRGSGSMLAPFKRGAFVIAKRARVPVVPVALLGTAAVLPRDAVLPRAGRVRVRVGCAIAPEEIATMTAGALSERVRRTLASMLEMPSARRVTVDPGHQEKDGLHLPTRCPGHGHAT